MIHSTPLLYSSLFLLAIGMGQFLLVLALLAPGMRGINLATGFLITLALVQIVLAVAGLVFSFKRPK